MPLLPTINTPSDLRKLSVDDLSLVAQEIREAIFEQVSKVGGHLAPNLGVVELTIALHYVFDFGHDRLLFDVGHQCYPHKLLTGRQGLLKNLRTRSGMAGFPEPRESAYDLFSVGHAGTGISTAVGMARGDLLNKESFDPESRPNGRRVVTLIGDASIVNGLAMEGLNGAGTLRRQFLVVLNDNGMSISKPQGAVSQYFDRVRLSGTYGEMKKRARTMLEGLPGGEFVKDAYHRLGEMAKAAVSEDSWFEHFGLVTVGPVDGHDLRTLVEFLNEAKHLDRPMVLHVKTIKGKGYDFAEGDATRFHSPAAFNYDPDSCRVEIKSEGRSFTSAFGEALTEMMKRDPKIVACTAAMPGGTGIDKVMAAHPERTFDSGICESHALDMLAGMAKTGWKPFFAVYSTFMQRAFDQAFQEVSLQGLAVRLCMDRAGLVGGDGAVHHGFCDISLLRTLPNAAITAAADEPSMLAALEFMRTYDTGLSACRWPRDNCSKALERFGVCPAFELGKARTLIKHDKPDVAVMAYGTMVISALEAIDTIGPEVRAELHDARFAKPVDEALLRSLLERRVPIVTIEDHGPHGGFGAAVVEAASALGLDAGLVTRMALPDAWVYQDSRKDQLAEVGLDPASIARMIRAAAAGGSPAASANAGRGPIVEIRKGSAVAKA
ncbi:MAG: 1-deoxy-D-xylulose-5-phosphate synthase [Phycisphaerales bacterium]